MPPKLMLRLLLPLCLVAWASHAWAQEGSAPMPPPRDEASPPPRDEPRPIDDPPVATPQPAGQAPGEQPAPATPSQEPGPSSEASPAEPERPPSRGGIRVRVADSRTGDPVIEARVEVVKGGRGTTFTDAEGRAEIDVPSGQYELRITADFYRPRRVAVTLVRGAPTTILRLRADEGVVQEVVVVGRPDTSTEAVQIVRRQKSATVSDAISAEQISRSPDSSAGDAVKRVVAATVQDGKYVVVRGLGGRYTSTLLNGVPLPSPDPDNPAAPLDLFPAAMLANLTVAKTFNPDIPGNFAGGSLAIETREFPSDFTLKLKMSTSVDTVSTFREARSSRGGSLDFLGYDDGTRAMPEMPDRRVVTSGQGAFSNDELSALARSFDNNWALYQSQAMPAVGLSATVGDTLGRDGSRFGYLGSVTYGTRRTRRLVDSRTVLNAMQVNQDFDIDQGVEQTALGGLINLGLEPAAGQRFGAISFYSHSSEDMAQVASGISDPESNQFRQRTRLRFLERSLAFGQLSGSHALADNEKLTLAWQGNLSFVSQDEPDVRDVTYQRDANGELRFDSSAGSADRYYVALSDLSGGGSLDLTLALARFKLKVGGVAQLTTRELTARRFHFHRHPGASMSDPRFLDPPDLLFSPDNMGTLIRLEESTRNGDGYQFTRNIYAAYAMVDLLSLAPLRVVTGARLEIADSSLLDSTRYATSTVRDPPTERLDVDVLPAVNAILALGEAQNLRASYSMTVARPHVREIAPFSFNDYARGRVLSGNPAVITTHIHNADLRFERFFSGTNLVAASAFYKRFVDPIEAVINANNDVLYQNVDAARSYGAELEARFALPLGFRAGANLSLIHSRVDFDSEEAGAQTSSSRPLQGQSPYVGNLELGYTVVPWKSDFTLLYNVLGERISEAGIRGSPDVYEQPFHRLDFSYSQKLPRSLQLKLSATNLLNQRARFKQGEVEVLGYDPGVAFLASMEWSFDR
jgi:hypothetical protein